MNSKTQRHFFGVIATVMELPQKNTDDHNETGMIQPYFLIDFVRWSDRDDKMKAQ